MSVPTAAKRAKVRDPNAWRGPPRWLRWRSIPMSRPMAIDYTNASPCDEVTSFAP